MLLMRRNLPLCLHNILNCLVFNKHNITASHNFPYYRVKQLVAKLITTITKKDTLPCLRIKL